MNEAVSLFGEKQISQKIEEAIREELLLFASERKIYEIYDI